MNPVCSVCGEIMAIDDPAEVAFDWIPGSPEIKRLFRLAQHRLMVWNCFGCGEFIPA